MQGKIRDGEWKGKEGKEGRRRGRNKWKGTEW